VTAPPIRADKPSPGTLIPRLGSALAATGKGEQMRGLRPRWLTMGAGLVLALLSTNCGGGGNSVEATLSNFEIALDSDTADSGDVTFKVKNDGPSVHEFVVFKTDLAPDKLPTTQERGVTIVDENGQGLESVDEVEDVANGASADLEVNLQPGHYVLVCNRSEDGGHYRQGMRTELTVSS
jgi:uncharacterized cupredoxin-like copper-binding protein